ncbi:MAG TPA: sigma-54 dependent transcriptional regulator [candidate division Zixibacteria bacterium]|nr:sigma-54 dependent transcriptional regulator [candidate division Zixibacteria bacterium]
MSEDLSLPSYLAPIKSPAFREVLELARMVAEFDSSVLLSGDTGVGKEVVARFIHDHSRRRERPMSTINCAALPSALLESELFGHKAGSFTGAIADRVGLFEQAARGTAFLDEIGDVEGSIQVKLLRVLQEREILRIGENTPRRVDIRVIAATNTDLSAAVEEGRFRKDLLFRLRVVEIRVPPLAERREDIPLLCDHFLTELSTRMHLPDLRLAEECRTCLTEYTWPGNVRELYNVMERAAIFSRGCTIGVEHLPAELRERQQLPRAVGLFVPRTLREVEGEHILRTLSHTGGNRPQAAEILGVSPSTLWRKLKEMEGGSSR